MSTQQNETHTHVHTHTCAHTHTRSQVPGQALQRPAKIHTSSTRTLPLCRPLRLLSPATTTPVTIAALGCPALSVPTPGDRRAREKEGSPPEGRAEISHLSVKCGVQLA